MKPRGNHSAAECSRRRDPSTARTLKAAQLDAILRQLNALALRRRGVSTARIASMAGCSEPTVLRWFEAHGHPTPPSGRKVARAP